MSKKQKFIQHGKKSVRQNVFSFIYPILHRKNSPLKKQIWCARPLLPAICCDQKAKTVILYKTDKKRHHIFGKHLMLQKRKEYGKIIVR